MKTGRLRASGRLRLAGIAVLIGIVGFVGCGRPTVTARPRGAADSKITPTPSSRPKAGQTPADQVIVHVPKRHGRIGVVVLHSFDHGVAELVAQGWNSIADGNGFVAIYPTRGSDWNAGLCCGTASRENRDDVAWLTTQIHRVEVRYGLSAVYLAGNSNGGMMVERLVSQVPGITRRFAVWAAAPEMPEAGDWPGFGYLFNGASDNTVPLAGGETLIGGKRVPIRPSVHTPTCLPKAHLSFVTLPHFGHEPPPLWPEMAWDAMAGGARASGASTRPC